MSPKTFNDSWSRRIPRDSRHNDKNRGRVIDPNIPFVHTAMLLSLCNLQKNKCYYCLKNMVQHTRRKGSDGLTLERLDNSLPHYACNVLALACKGCNSRKYPRDYGLKKRYFSIWRERVLGINSPKTERRSSFA